MSRYTYDLHVHSCLSPCADNDNTPNNLAGMATLNNIQIMALTDHNSCRNCPAFFTAAKRYGIIPVPGMELTTSEDIHVVCLFPELENALRFNDEVDRHRIRFPNDKEIFGDQLILDGEDELIYPSPVTKYVLGRIAPTKLDYVDAMEPEDENEPDVGVRDDELSDEAESIDVEGSDGADRSGQDPAQKKSCAA